MVNIWNKMQLEIFFYKIEIKTSYAQYKDSPTVLDFIDFNVNPSLLNSNVRLDYR